MITTESKAKIGLLVVACLLANTGNALADEHADRAETLFQQARDLMSRNDFAKACPMLEEAYSLDHGAGTLLALALCHEGNGKPASALREYRESLAIAVRANRADRVMLAEAGAQRLEATVPRIKVKPPTPEPSEFTLSLDGVPLDRATMIVGAPVDPGTHAVVATGHEVIPWKTSIDVAAAPLPNPIVLEIPTLASPSAAPAPAPIRSAPPSRTPGWIAVGVGVAGLAAGSAFGILSFQAEANSKAACHQNVCSPNGFDLNHDASRDAIVSDVSFAVSGVALVAGVYLLLRASSVAHAPPAKGSVTLHPRAGEPLGFALSW